MGLPVVSLKLAGDMVSKPDGFPPVIQAQLANPCGHVGAHESRLPRALRAQRSSPWWPSPAKLDAERSSHALVVFLTYLADDRAERLGLGVAFYRWFITSSSLVVSRTRVTGELSGVTGESPSTLWTGATGESATESPTATR